MLHLDRRNVYPWSRVRGDAFLVMCSAISLP